MARNNVKRNNYLAKMILWEAVITIAALSTILKLSLEMYFIAMMVLFR